MFITLYTGNECQSWTEGFDEQVEKKRRGNEQETIDSSGEEEN